MTYITRKGFETTASIVCMWLFFVFMSWIMSSCNPSKKIAKAEATVISNPPSLEKVGRLWEKFNPCVNDTLTTRDTLREEIPIWIEADCPDSTRVILKPYSFDTTVAGVRVRVAGGKLQVTGKKETVVQTVTHTVEDTRRLDLCKADLMAASTARDIYKKDSEELRKQLIEQDKKARWTLWKNRIFIGLPLLLIILAFIFKKRIPLLKNL